ncbi:MAG: hypothetical protein H0W04_04700 [Chthoniobacterales bacterium]|nr:hypothetical protein [Chthoniobacterales bacterium]
MDASSGRKIEIFEPFSRAFDLTKLILFQPFDVAKWFVIGFAAFLSHLAGGGGGQGFNFNSKLMNGDWKWKLRSTTHEAFGSADTLPGWALPLIGIGVVVGIALVIVCLWIGARGKFIFTDCVVRNRGAIVEPWRSFKREGNSYFLFSLLVAVIILAVAGLASLPLWLPLAIRGEAPQGANLVMGISLLAIVLMLIMVGYYLISSFMIPVMYRRKCGAGEAFGASVAAIMAYPGPVILYVLFSVVLYVAFAMSACLLTCVTCCITAIPYLGTVILLPFYVFFLSYLLLFVRQFGPTYDAWANVAAIEAAPSTAATERPASEPPEPPPVQL